MATIIFENFEWDEYKNIANQEKHHISFEAAVQIFENVLVEALTKDIYGEQRIITVGMLENKEIVVISTNRHQRILGKKT